MRQIVLSVAVFFGSLFGGLGFAGAGDQALSPRPVEPSSSDTSASKDAALSDKMTATLRKAGFTDLKIMPNSILVRGKDKAGQPVAMVLHPGSMTEVVTLDPHSGSAAAGDGTEKPLTGSSTFATVLPSARMASTLVGLKVRNGADKDVGTIKDLAIDHDGITAYIVAVGGLLGLGDHYVAVAPKAIEIEYDTTANAYRARMNATGDQLKAAPPFAYEGSFKAGRK